MIERQAIIGSKVGLHARPAAIFTEAVAELPFEVTIAPQDAPAEDAMDASSILSIMGLGAQHGDVVVLRAEDNRDAPAALDRLVTILETDHDE